MNQNIIQSLIELKTTYVSALDSIETRPSNTGDFWDDKAFFEAKPTLVAQYQKRIDDLDAQIAYLRTL